MQYYLTTQFSGSLPANESISVKYVEVNAKAKTLKVDFPTAYLDDIFYNQNLTFYLVGMASDTSFEVVLFDFKRLLVNFCIEPLSSMLSSVEA